VLDDLGREAMAAVAERSHAGILSDTPLAPDSVSVAMPAEPISPADEGRKAVRAAQVELARSPASGCASSQLLLDLPLRSTVEAAADH
jgi:hypothetical protein